MMTQNWIEKNGDGTVSEWGQNPYWLKNRVLSGYKRYRAVASARANLHITDYFNLQVRGNVDYISDKFDNKMYATYSSQHPPANTRTRKRTLHLVGQPGNPSLR